MQSEGVVISSWTTTLSSRLCDSARAMALEIASRVSDLETLKSATRVSPTQASIPGLVTWNPPAIAQGSSGLAVLFSYLDSCFPENGWDLNGKQHLEFAARTLEANGLQSLGLFGGASGVGFATWCLSKNGLRFRGLASSIDEAITNPVIQLLDRMKCSKRGVAYHDYDAISGLAGIGSYFLCRADQAMASEVLHNIITYFVQLTLDHDNLAGWYTPHNLLNDSHMSVAHPNGVINCGLAHGVPGPLALLANAALNGIRVEGLQHAIVRIVDWLVCHRCDDDWGINWPTVVPLELDEKGLQAGSSTAMPGSRSAWCYGSPGISRAIWLAGKAVGRVDYEVVAIEAMKSVFSKPVSDRQIPSPTFCHGVAGLLHLTCRFANDTGLPLFRDAAADLAERLIEAYEPQSILGYRSIEANGRRIDNPGLLDGAPGVALALLSAASTAVPIWDRLFLLS